MKDKVAVKRVLTKKSDPGMEVRATYQGFMRYMMANPIYFEDLTGEEATPININRIYNEYLSVGLVAAERVPNNCSCYMCRASLKERRGEGGDDE